MTQVTRDNTDNNLLAEIGDNIAGWAVEEFGYPQATVANQRWQVVFNPESGRAGLVFCGSGSSGHTLWTDATSADDAYQRMLRDELSP